MTSLVSVVILSDATESLLLPIELDSFKRFESLDMVSFSLFLACEILDGRKPRGLSPPLESCEASLEPIPILEFDLLLSPR